jgi:hypothetical protein
MPVDVLTETIIERVRDEVAAYAGWLRLMTFFSSALVLAARRLGKERRQRAQHVARKRRRARCVAQVRAALTEVTAKPHRRRLPVASTSRSFTRTGLALHPDPSAVALNDAPGDEESQAQPSAVILA